VPFALCGEHVHAVLRRPLSEAHAAESDLHIDFGHELMEYFLRAGLTG
jgi:2,3-bisphosphoglycerate-independent phosphoglycerate mutase